LVRGKWLEVGMLTLGIVGLLLLVGANSASPSRLAVLGKAPDFILTSHEGKTRRISDFRGKVLLVSFVFTTCNGTCPATTHRMILVQHELDKRGLTKSGGIHLLSITLDPVRDTPEILRGYMRLYDVDSATWDFLTGPPDQVAKTVAAWGMWARPAPNGQLDHPSRIFLVDREARMREIYNLNFLKPAWVAEDVDLLLHEGQ
jgi:protein SCO1/2